LKPGGHFVGTIPDADVLVKKWREGKGTGNGRSFGNTIFSVDFGDPGCGSAPKSFDPKEPFGHCYNFTLKEVIDACPEYLVHFPTLQRLARDEGLELVCSRNFHEFFHDQRIVPAHKHLLEAMKVVHPEGTPSKDEWEVCGLYMVFTFRKNKDAEREASPLKVSSTANLSRAVFVPSRRIEPSDIVRVNLASSAMNGPVASGTLSSSTSSSSTGSQSDPSVPLIS
jgi:hypothetical protein